MKFSVRSEIRLELNGTEHYNLHKNVSIKSFSVASENEKLTNSLLSEICSFPNRRSCAIIITIGLGSHQRKFIQRLSIKSKVFPPIDIKFERICIIFTLDVWRKKGSAAGFSCEAANVIDFSVGIRLSADCKCMQTVSRNENRLRLCTKKSHFSCFTSFKELRVHNRIVSYRSRFGWHLPARTHFNNHSNSAINNIKTLSMPNERENAEKYA